MTENDNDLSNLLDLEEHLFLSLNSILKLLSREQEQVALILLIRGLKNICELLLKVRKQKKTLLMGKTKTNGPLPIYP